MITPLSFAYLPRRWRWLRRCIAMVLGLAFPLYVLIRWPFMVLEAAEEWAEVWRVVWRGQWAERNRRGAILIVHDGERPAEEDEP
jgi:hypothetical protein